ncbi:helix-turn-helix domain-containing protein [Bordetella sp. LUAb4]|uniref:helix-turn-helix domain-containing protein n=1 Tax=Bordetella sp. LUAb4 TaxID=2843195 RepID=UPI001E4B39FA|nr:helix-turn-helix domain-containing protein [Bordetella sp. LUAb4]
MSPFVLIQDGQRLTLQMCESPRARYSWFLFTADCSDAGFGPDRLIARSEELAGEPTAKKEGMTALLAYKRHIGFDALGRDRPGSDGSIAHPASWEPRTIDQLVDSVGSRLDQLGTTLDLIRRRLADVRKVAPASSLPPNADVPDEPQAVSHSPNTWRLLEGGFMLVSPVGIKVALSAAEQQFLSELFRAPEAHITYDQACRALAESSAEPVKSHSSLSVLVTRLRAKCRERGLDLPLHTLRGIGYHFAADTAV